jgi:hypothetical protein
MEATYEGDHTHRHDSEEEEEEEEKGSRPGSSAGEAGAIKNNAAKTHEGAVLTMPERQGRSRRTPSKMADADDEATTALITKMLAEDNNPYAKLYGGGASHTPPHAHHITTCECEEPEHPMSAASGLLQGELTGGWVGVGGARDQICQTTTAAATSLRVAPRPRSGRAPPGCPGPQACGGLKECTTSMGVWS